VSAAATRTWDGGGGDANWMTAQNWVGDIAPSAGDDLVFPDGAARPFNTNNFPAGTTFSSIFLSGPGCGYQISGNQIVVTSAVQSNVAGTFVTCDLQLPIQLTGTVNAVVASGMLTISGVVSGSGSLAKAGNGFLRLSGNNTFTGTILINGGYLTAQVASAFGAEDGTPATGTVVNSGGTLQVGGYTLGNESLTLNGLGQSGNGALQTLAQTTIDGPVILGSDTRVALGLANSSITVTGTISGAGTLIKTGAGTLTLTANNTYTQTDLEAGSLYINGSQTNVSVNMSAGLIGGTGASGDIYSTGGTLAPGLSPGTFSSTNVQLAASGTFAVEINGPSAGSGYDQLIVTGQVILGNATLSGSTGFVPSAGATFVIINNQGSDAISGIFNGLPQGATVTLGSQAYSISYTGGDGNDVVLTALAAVPTMSGMTLGALGALMTIAACWRLGLSTRHRSAR
jgi:autotransporter-associated beta strand protein